MMTVTLTKAKKYFSEDGVVLCEVEISLPAAIAGEGEERTAARVTRFYERVGAAVLQLAEERVVPIARKALTATPPARRRAAWRPYRLTVRTAIEGEGGGFAVTRTLTLTHRGRPLLAEEVCEEITAAGRLLPRDTAHRRTCRTRGIQGERRYHKQ